MKKKVFVPVIILVFLLIFGARLFILSAGIWDYLHTEDNCRDVPLQGQLPSVMLIYEVKPYMVITDKGNMYPGDEYQSYGEGAWYGMATLLSLGKNGATFLVTYPDNDPVKGYSRKNCKAFLPVGDSSQ
jgi:hypothetical protein